MCMKKSKAIKVPNESLKANEHDKHQVAIQTTPAEQQTLCKAYKEKNKAKTTE